jgi:DNA-binding NtrC family response regulator
MKATILLVDDEPAIRFALSQYLAQTGCIVVESANLKEACASLNSTSFDALILDLELPDGNGLEYIARFKARYPAMAVVVVTATLDRGARQEAMLQGADEFFAKPLGLDKLCASLQTILAKRGQPSLQPGKHISEGHEELIA